MKSFSVLASLGLWVCSTALQAADIVVEPGQNTLQNAIITASEGDTLLLTTGAYQHSESYIYLDKSLTIKAESAASDPVIHGVFTTVNTLTGNIDYLRLQGVTIQALTVTNYRAILIDKINHLEILESTIRNGELYFTTAGEGTSFTMVGSRLECWNKHNSISVYGAEDIYFLGNDLCLDEYSGQLLVGAMSDVQLVGNRIVTQSVYPVLRLYNVGNGSVLRMAANRITQRVPIDGFNASGSYSWFDLSSYPSRMQLLDIRNNIFNFDVENHTDAERTVSRYSIVSGTGTSTGAEWARFENNVFDYSGLLIQQPGFGETEQAPMILVAPKLFRGNIVAHYADVVLPDTLKTALYHNVCYDNQSNCGTEQGNLEVDPLWVAPALSDYQLTAASPAIDAGPEDLLLYDVDNTRNDIGAYAGSWSIDQFDVQRDPNTLGPYLYPLIEAGKSVADGNVKVQFLTYPRLK